AKLQALNAQRDQLEQCIKLLATKIAAFEDTRRGLMRKLDTLSKLAVYKNFQELDWATSANQVATLKDEHRALQSASNILQQLSAQLEALHEQMRDTERKLKEQADLRSRSAEKMEAAQTLREECQSLIDANQTSVPAARLNTLRENILGQHTLSVESCDHREREMRDALQARIDNESKKLERLRDGIIKTMSDFKQHYALETAEFDASVEAAGEYRGMLERLAADDLPRFEARFKELLNENTIREVANFHSQLNRERETIKERIASINQSLAEIDYNPGRFIVLETQPSPDADLRDFQAELRACTEGSLSGDGDAQYSEQRFLKVKSVIERFRGRDGLTELDRRWTAKVTDVRNWFLFNASERQREDGSEYEHYSDSGGKSGGQKEKLAYTILAASLAYQFGLEWNAVRSRSFRFVVIDEAFGRGSDESAHYGLQLFAKLNLQLLIVTPLQKIHVIEPFVSSVGFVQNVEGNASQLRNLSIEAYREEKAMSAP
ncbi:MAG: ATP-dependent exonuclease SbcCD, C subunit-like protein, partial [Xanthomonadales bacterium]|nr:ATP-dependent exonuclease SbcCD, C subunit-like protein [Xanthomonadales bacterium]